MFITQLSVFVENKSGRLADIVSVLGNNKINILALSIPDTADFGILRLIVEDPEKAYNILRKNDIMVKKTEVLAVALSHTAGSLAKILTLLETNNFFIEYMYDFSNRLQNEDPMVILRLNEPEAAAELMRRHGIRIMDERIVMPVKKAE